MAQNQTLTRREFLQGCSAAIAALAGSRITNLAFAKPDAQTTEGEIFVVVFLRGGADGLTLVPPIGGASNDRGYYETARPLLRYPIDANTVGGRALPVGSLGSTQFGLHPALAPIHSLYQAGFMGIVHAAGLVNATRSHFDAQALIEGGAADTTVLRTSTTGWLTRYLQTLTLTGATFPAISANSATAGSLLGFTDAVALTGASGLSIWSPWQYRDQQRLALSNMYASASTPLHLAGINTLNTLDTVEQTLGSYQPAAGSNYVLYDGFSDQLKTIAQMIKAGLGLRTATIDLGGWDSHENQQDGQLNGAGGYLNGLLDRMARGLLAFFNDLGPHTRRTTIMVMSEFGRRFFENKNRGTDHGHGNAMFVLGGGVNGGRMFGQWPGLGKELGQLDKYDDLQVTTDYRAVLTELLAYQLASADARAASGVSGALSAIFPDYTAPVTPLGLTRTPAQTYVSPWRSTYVPMVQR